MPNFPSPAHPSRMWNRLGLSRTAGRRYEDGIHLDFTTGRHYRKVPGGSAQRAPFTTLFAFTRGTTGTYRGGDGLIRTAAVNEPRLEYDLNGGLLGLLVENARTNICLQSADLATTWLPGQATVGSNVTTAPDGTTNADKIQEDNTNNSHTVKQSISYTSGTAYTYSAFVKAAERGWCVLELPGAAFGGAGNWFAYFNLSTGAIGTTSGTVAARTTQYANGWWRLELVATATASSAGNTWIDIATADASSSYLGTTGNGIYVWGVQVEAGLCASSYIPTTTGSVTRNADSAIRTLSSEYSTTVGTFVLEAAQRCPDDVLRTVMTLVDGAANTTFQRSRLQRNSGTLQTRTNNQVQDASVLQADFTSAFADATGAVFKTALAWAVNDFVAYTRGVQDGTDASGTTGGASVTECRMIGGSFFNEVSYIRKLDYWPERKVNAELVIRTT